MGCSDINECANENSCDEDSICNNTIGSYSRARNGGYSGDGVNCDDINECHNDSHNCSVNGSCTNLKGSYECSCNNGFNGDGVICSERDSILRQMPDRGRNGSDSIAILLEIFPVVGHPATHRSDALKRPKARCTSAARSSSIDQKTSPVALRVQRVGTVAHSVSFVLTPHQIITVF